MPNYVVDMPIVTATFNRKAVTTAGTAVILLTAGTATERIIIKALPGNTDSIYVGEDDVDSTTGYPLDPGEAIILSIDHSKLPIYIDSAVDGEGVAYVYGKKRSN